MKQDELELSEVPHDIFRKKNLDTQIQDRQYLLRGKTGNKVYSTLLLQTKEVNSAMCEEGCCVCNVV